MSDYHITILVLICIWSLVALGLNIISGYAGLFNLGIGVYMGTGAYASAVLTTTYGLSFWVALPLALIIAGLMGLLTGLPALRVKEDSLTTISIGLVFVFESLLIYLPHFGGPVGIGRIPVPVVAGEPIGKMGYLVLSVAMLAMAVALNWKLATARIGLAWQSMREDELAARVIAMDPGRLKLYAYVVGAVLAGAGGVLYAHFMNYITPYDFGFLPSVYVLVMIVFGGLGTIRGVLFGAAFLTAMPELFRFIQDYRNLLYGGMLITLMLFMPKGVLGTGRIPRRLRRKPDLNTSASVVTTGRAA